MESDGRRSLIVNLTVLGLGGLVLAARVTPAGQTMQRNLYRDRASCERDYSQAQCQQDGSTSRGSGSHFHGPYYLQDRSTSGVGSDPGPGRFHLAASVETSTRGGFGSFGRAMRAIG